SQIYAVLETIEGLDSARVTVFKRYWEIPRDELARGLIAMGEMEIPLLDNDPNFPEDGVLRLTVIGGRGRGDGWPHRPRLVLRLLRSTRAARADRHIEPTGPVADRFSHRHLRHLPRSAAGADQRRAGARRADDPRGRRLRDHPLRAVGR